MIRHAITSSHCSSIPYLIHIAVADHDVIKHVPVFRPSEHLSIVVCILMLKYGIRNHKAIVQRES